MVKIRHHVIFLKMSVTVLLAGKFICPDSVNGFCREERCNLLLLPEKTRQYIPDVFFVDLIRRISMVDGFLKVVGRRGGSERNACDIFLALFLQFLGKLGRLSYAHQQHPRGQRIQRPGMAYLQIFLMEMPARSPFQLPDHVCRRPPVRLVHRDDYPTWKVAHVAGELAAKENLVRYQNLFFHYTGILSIRLWWRPPSNWVESHVFRMRVAIG